MGTDSSSCVVEAFADRAVAHAEKVGEFVVRPAGQVPKLEELAVAGADRGQCNPNLNGEFSMLDDDDGVVDDAGRVDSVERSAVRTLTEPTGLLPYDQPEPGGECFRGTQRWQQTYGLGEGLLNDIVDSLGVD